MQIEMDGKDFYLEIESRVNNKGFKSIFSMLANDEEKHYAVLKVLRDKQPPMEKTGVLKNAKNIFADTKGKSEEFTASGSHVDMFKKAKIFTLKRQKKFPIRIRKRFLRVWQVTKRGITFCLIILSNSFPGPLHGSKMLNISTWMSIKRNDLFLHVN